MALTKSDEDTLKKKKLKFEHSLFAIITLFLVSYKVHLHSLSFISLRQSMQTREYVGCFPSCVNTTTRLGQSFNVERANSLRKCTPIFKNPLGALHPVHSTARWRNTYDASRAALPDVRREIQVRALWEGGGNGTWDMHCAGLTRPTRINTMTCSSSFAIRTYSRILVPNKPCTARVSASVRERESLYVCACVRTKVRANRIIGVGERVRVSEN